MVLNIAKSSNCVIPNGGKLRQKRLEKGLTQESLSFIAKVSKSSVERVEKGKPTQITTLKMITEAIGGVDIKEVLVNSDNYLPNSDIKIIEQRHNLLKSMSNSKPVAEIKFVQFASEIGKINFIRFVPFYIGKLDSIEMESYLEFEAHSFEKFKMVYFDDGFVVAVLPGYHECTNVQDFLWQRRRAHLDLLKSETSVLKVLLNRQEKKSSHPLILSLPKSFHYVMSIHHVDNIDGIFSRHNLILMAEPSISGITDSPKEKFTENTLASISVDDFNQDKLNVFETKTEDAIFYIGWASIIIENLNSYNKNIDIIISLEIQLQKLWYKLYTFSKTLNNIIDNIESYDKEKLRKIKMEIIRTRIEYTNFISVDATGSSHMHDIRAQLIKTSKLPELYGNFEYKYKLLEEFKEIL